MYFSHFMWPPATCLQQQTQRFSCQTQCEQYWTVLVKMTQISVSRKKKGVENSPPPLWGACISCTPSATSSLCARLFCVAHNVSDQPSKTLPPPPDGLCVISGDVSAHVGGWWARVMNYSPSYELFHRNQRTLLSGGERESRNELGSGLSPPITPTSQAARERRRTGPEDGASGASK